MATQTAVSTQHATLSGTTVDTITLSQIGIKFVEIMNTVGSADLWVTFGSDTLPPVDPVASADETFRVKAGEAVNIPVLRTNRPTVIKILGSGNTYSVHGQVR